MLTLQEIRVDTIDVVVFVVLTPVDTFLREHVTMQERK